MPGMPGTRNMPGAPGVDNNWEFPRNRSMPRGEGLGMQPAGRVQSPLIGKSASMNPRPLPQGSGSLAGGRPSALLHGSGNPRPSTFVSGTDPDTNVHSPVKAVPAAPNQPVAASSKSSPDLRRKTISLLEEYFSILLLDEALQCVEELHAPAYHPDIVKEAVSLALEKSPPRVEPVSKLLEHLFAKNVLTAGDITTGCLLYGSMLDDIAIDLPKAPNNFGEIIGKLVLVGALDFKVVKEILVKVEDPMFQKAIYNAAVATVTSSPSGQSVMSSQESDIGACQVLF